MIPSSQQGRRGGCQSYFGVFSNKKVGKYFDAFVVLRNKFYTLALTASLIPPVLSALLVIPQILLKNHIDGSGIHMHPRIQVYTIATISFLFCITESQERFQLNSTCHRQSCCAGGRLFKKIGSCLAAKGKRGRLCGLQQVGCLKGDTSLGRKPDCNVVVPRRRRRKKDCKKTKKTLLVS